MNAASWKSALLLTILVPIIAGLQGGAVWLTANLLERTEPPSQSQLGALAGTLPTAPPVAEYPVPAEKSAEPIRQAVPLRLAKTPSATASVSTVPPTYPLAGYNTTLDGAQNLPTFVVAGIVASADKEAFPKAESAQPGTDKKSEEAQNHPNPIQSAVNATAAGEQTQTVTPEPGPTAAVTSELQEPAWLQTRDPKHYTLQLHRSRDLEGLKAFASVNALPQPLAYYRTGRQPGSWYVLVAGDYPDAQTARAALNEFSKRLPKLNPWLRDFGKIQAQIR